MSSSFAIRVLFSFIWILPWITHGHAEELPGEARTDAFETKMQLLQRAWQNRDYELARSLTHSLRDTVIQAQHTDSPLAPLPLAMEEETPVSQLPQSWQQWAAPWHYFRAVRITETAGLTRRNEPVEMSIAFRADHLDSLVRELRIAQIEQDGTLREISSQVYGEIQRDGWRIGKVIWLANVEAQATSDYLLFVGNPDAELPQYPSDLRTIGEGVGLDIDNSHFKIRLSRQTGQLERLTLLREHGLELFSGGEGHGEPPGIDWAHDYVDAGNFQKMRISLWDQCPDYEVVRGPLCTIVRRWGFPYSPVHPVFTPSRLLVTIEYRFFSGQPWFLKLGTMEAIQEMQAEALRDDEWVFSGQSFTEKVWMTRDGHLRFGNVDREYQNDLWGVGFINDTSRDSFIALFLEHQADGLPDLVHQGEPTLFYRWHGHVWSRYPLTVKKIPQGAVLRQKNAYLSIPFTREDGPKEVETLRAKLMDPLMPKRLEVQELTSDAHESPHRLARPGEAGDATISKRAIWTALRDCKDAQLYTADIHVVDLGLIDDVRVRGDVVTIVMTMPHRGRPLAGYFAHGSIEVHPQYSRPIRERLLQLPGVREVVVEQTWYPGWTSNRLTDEGRRRLGL